MPPRPKVESDDDIEKRVSGELAEKEKPYGDIQIKLKDKEMRARLLASAIAAEKEVQRQWRERAEARKNLPAFEAAFEKAEKQLAEAIEAKGEAERVLAKARFDSAKMIGTWLTHLNSDISRPKWEWQKILQLIFIRGASGPSGEVVTYMCAK